MSRAWRQNFRDLLRHKWFVLIACIELGVPLWSALLHDWDKLRLSELRAYTDAIYSPDGTKHYLPSEALDRAWNFHQKHNKHHWEYWVTFDYQTHQCRPLPMPDSARREMLADWIGAGKAKHGASVSEWYQQHQQEMILHPDTRRWIEQQMGSQCE